MPLGIMTGASVPRSSSRLVTHDARVTWSQWSVHDKQNLHAEWLHAQKRYAQKEYANNVSLMSVQNKQNLHAE